MKHQHSALFANPAEARANAPLDARSALEFSLLQGRFAELDLSLDAEAGVLWCRLAPDGPPSFTPSMVRELNALHRMLRATVAGPRAKGGLRYYVQGSTIPGIYNMGGDLAFLVRSVRAGDREAVRAYALGCVQSVHDIAVGFDRGVVTVGLVQGDALGGGLEAALCCNVIIAERSARMGLPEILFNSFPGMGAYSFLSRRVGMALAERMILSGDVYTATQMEEMGLVDMVVDDGAGEQAVRDYVGAPDRLHRVRSAIYGVRQRVAAVTLTELREVTEMWVDLTMELGHQDLRRMERLQAAQSRRIGPASPEAATH